MSNILTGTILSKSVSAVIGHITKKTLLPAFDSNEMSVFLVYNNSCEFSTSTHKFKWFLSIENPDLNANFEDFWFTNPKNHRILSKIKTKIILIAKCLALYILIHILFRNKSENLVLNAGFKAVMRTWFYIILIKHFLSV